MTVNAMAGWSCGLQNSWRSEPDWRFKVAADDASTQLRVEGIAVLRGVFSKGVLTRLKESADRCFQAVRTEKSLPDRYQLSRSANSLLLSALLDFGCDAAEDLTAPLSATVLERLFLETMGPHWTCDLGQSWVRQKFAQPPAPASGYHLQDWHQDGALGARFPVEPGPLIAMTELLTCWIPLNDCGIESPGLEFIRSPQSRLLHFTELGDSALRERFPPQAFWVPVLEFGDAVVFLNNILHRTFVRPGMRHDRLSVEYRIFP